MNDSPPAKHLIIAGVTRAGTTSLFNYLADHPRICPSTIKETRFFLDRNDLKRLHHFEQGLSAYENYFPNCPENAVRLEATPDYVYCPTAAKRIAESLPDMHIVLILREPIARLISWRKYAIQNGLLTPNVTLTQYIDQLFEAEAGSEIPPQHMRALTEGRYAQFLKPWIDTFAPDRLTVCNYRELMDDPAGLTRRLCSSIDIDPAFYDGYAFEVHNASRQVRWPHLHGAYRSLIWRIKPHVHDRPALRSLLRNIRRKTDALLGRCGQQTKQPDPGDSLTDADRARLEAYYQQQPGALCDILGRDDWHW